MSEITAKKQQQFNEAMEKYEKIKGYRLIGRLVSFEIVALQVILAALIFQRSIGFMEHLLALAAAYILADFINGLVHMYMDNNDDYGSLAGPLIASFHLHHRTPRYKQNPLAVVYFNETGSKLWLAFLMPIAVIGVWQGFISGMSAYIVLYFSVLSSAAEVSHYLCHIPNSKVPHFFAKAGLLLSIRRHLRHHAEDNTGYAFLNGMTDPLLNIIAKAVYPGYKNTTDTHYALYTGAGTENRE